MVPLTPQVPNPAPKATTMGRSGACGRVRDWKSSALPHTGSWAWPRTENDRPEGYCPKRPSNVPHLGSASLLVFGRLLRWSVDYVTAPRNPSSAADSHAIGTLCGPVPSPVADTLGLHWRVADNGSIHRS